MSSTTTRRIITSSIVFSAILFFVLLALQMPLSAKVTGPCVNCHTMHNSQNGSSVARTGDKTGWDNGVLSGGTVQDTPLKTLLTTNCVGCHSSTTNQTIITVNSSKIPIVYNTVQPEKPLAGGNFFWVVSDETKGHNVYGIAAQDSKHKVDKGAPGKNQGCGQAESCHMTLAAPPHDNNLQKGGCQGCHTQVAHHDDSKLWYRFLKGHADTVDYVEGVEDANWEQDPTVGHNWYKGTTNPYSTDGHGLMNNKTASSFCSGCHGAFHGPTSGNDGMGSSSPWTRHPTDIAMRTDGEYADYGSSPIANYSAQAPVAFTDPVAKTGPVVMCLSCHRAHGSDQPDMLRWNYNDMNAGTTGAAAGTGCFKCHSGKDGK